MTGAKVKARTLRASDFALGQLPSGKPGAPGASGAAGPAGPAGAKGEQGVQGVPGVVGAITVNRQDFGLTDNSTAGASVPCPAGTRVIGGGSQITATPANSAGIAPTVSRPDRTGIAPLAGETFDGWRVAYHNPIGGGGDTTVHAFAVCAQG